MTKITETTPSPSLLSNREQLMAMLGEAAEVEHNLMCCYLYAAFSIKTDVSEGLTEQQVAKLGEWKRSIISIAVEEMSHLALVANLSISIGGVAHFGRLNFPILPGPMPANISVKLAPFDMETLDHFIFLERPEQSEVKDGLRFETEYDYVRGPIEQSKLMPVAHDYETVGQLYNTILESFELMNSKLGSEGLFLGSKDQQIGPRISPLPGLRTISDIEDVRLAIDTIVTQGEGAPTNCGAGHFARFCKIKEEYIAFLEDDAEFQPGRPVAENPVMRRPISAENRVWVTEPDAASLMDFVNALYIQMLRLLSQGFGRSGAPSEKQILIQTATDLMHAMTPAAEELTKLKANQTDNCNAGMSFAMTKSIAALPAFSEWHVLASRFTEIIAVGKDLISIGPQVKKAIELVENIAQNFNKQVKKITEHNDSETNPTDKKNTVEATVQEIEIANGEHLDLFYDASKCIHARFCVTGAPQTFLANVDGDWLYPDTTHPDKLSAVAEACPSGAITVKRKDGRPNEMTPEVNLAFIRENGPIAIHADIQMKGQEDGYRRTLCRCGKSKTKPYCDTSHIEAGFKASGEAEAGQIDMLDIRNGKLEVEPLTNGPLQINGPLEICSGTGRVVERTETVRLCRCGASSNKPFCDNSHLSINFQAD